MSTIKLAGAAWSFVGTSLVESAHIWRALGVHAMDLLAVPGTPIDAEEIDRDPQDLARRFTEPGMELPNLIYIFGAGFEDRAINSVDPAVRRRNMETLKNVLECCQAAHIRSLLILPGVDQPGLEIQSLPTIGKDTTNQVFFEDVFVPDDYLVGKRGAGFKYIAEALDLERFTMFTLSPIADRSRVLVDWVKTAVRDDEPLKDDANVRRTIAHIATDTAVAKALSTRFVCAAMSGGKPPTIESSQYKLFTTTLSQRVCKDALDVTGAAGQIREGQEDAPLAGRFEGAYRATMNETVGGGSSEIQKNIIARRKLGLPKNF